MKSIRIRNAIGALESENEVADEDVADASAILSASRSAIFTAVASVGATNNVRCPAATIRPCLCPIARARQIHDPAGETIRTLITRLGVHHYKATMAYLWRGSRRFYDRSAASSREQVISGHTLSFTYYLFGAFDLTLQKDSARLG